MTEQTTQTTIDWRYLPELPPEPEGVHKERYLVTNIIAVHEGWYEGDGNWSVWTGSDVKAWAEWPEAPPTRKG